MCKWRSEILPCPCRGWGVTAGQLDLPPLTPLSVAGCGRLQLRAAHWATSVALLQAVDIIDPTNSAGGFYTGELLAIKHFVFSVYI